MAQPKVDAAQGCRREGIFMRIIQCGLRRRKADTNDESSEKEEKKDWQN
jgi:hypothetical protein